MNDYNTSHNLAVEAKELAHWLTRPDTFIAYYDVTAKTVTTWLGTVVGTIVSSHVYKHNMGGRFVSLKAKGTNGATYHGRASYDNGNAVLLRKAKG